MNSAALQDTISADSQTLELFNYNRRVMRILLTKNCITSDQYTRLSEILEQDLKQGRQQPVAEILKSYQLVNPEVVTREVFKYNQIILKLAHQFLKNTTVQTLSIAEESPETIQEKLDELTERFSALIASVTDDYIKGDQRDIDEILRETGLLDQKQIDFLHNGANHLEIKSLDRKFGDIAVKNQFTTKEVVDRALMEQTVLYHKTRKNHIIGDIMVRRKEMTPETRDEILLLQNRVLEEDWEDVLRRIGQSAIEEQEKNALFGALVVKEHLMAQEQVIEALQIQHQERETYEQRKAAGATGRDKDASSGPRWIGDILVQDFGMSEDDRKRIVKKQMQYRIETINLKFGINLKDAQRELFHEIDTYFQLLYSKDRIKAYIRITKEIPDSMTKDNLVLWLYHKRIIYGRISSAIQKILEKKVAVGEKILVAKGEDPIAEDYTPIFHFGDNGRTDASRAVPEIVKKGDVLVTIRRQPGTSGINVNRCFVSAAARSSYKLVKGANVVRENGEFLAACDGVPDYSGKGVLSISPVIRLSGDLSGDLLPESLSCDIEVRGAVLPGSEIRCRELTANVVRGRVSCSGDVVANQAVEGADINSSQSVSVAAVVDSSVTGARNVTIQPHEKSRKKTGGSIQRSIVTSNDVLRISETHIIESIVRARNRIILRKADIGNGCKFIVGDSAEIIAAKRVMEEMAGAIDQCVVEIQSLQQESQDLFLKMEKKDISSLDAEITALEKKQVRSREVLERIRVLKKEKRKKEREFEKKYDEYGDSFVEISNKISMTKEKKALLEKERADLGKKVLALYREESSVPEIDARRATIPKGTVIQFRHTLGKVDADYAGFVFREEYDETTQAYAIKKHRW